MSSPRTTPAPGVPEITLGWRLQIALRHAGMTVQDMAEELGMARSSLSRWLNDHGTPPRDVFVKQWALRTGVPFEWLKEGHIAADENGPRSRGSEGREDVRHQGLEPRTRWLRPGHLADLVDLGEYRREREQVAS